MDYVAVAFAAWALTTLPTFTGFPYAALTLDIICRYVCSVRFGVAPLS